jgi:membrane protein YdbS with pleckstrin-like domain
MIMAVEQTRASIIGRIWQAVAQSGVDLSSIDRDEQDRLVATIADSLLVEVNTMLGEARIGAAGVPYDNETSVDNSEESLLWEGRPFLSLTEHYTITSQRIRIRRGLLGKETEDIELFRIKDIEHSQHLTERMVNIGDVVLHTSDTDEPTVTLRNVSDPEEVHEIIRRAVLDARRQHHVGFREEM